MRITDPYNIDRFFSCELEKHSVQRNTYIITASNSIYYVHTYFVSIYNIIYYSGHRKRMPDRIYSVVAVSTGNN